MQLRLATREDRLAVSALILPVFARADTYAVAPDISEAAAHALWMDAPAATYVACTDAGEVVGTWFIKANQGGGGAHVCNCGYIVSPAARGQGLAERMCVHSQAEARRLGFRAMQFNFVVSTNAGAVRLWKKLGFRIVGTLPGAFDHPDAGMVDAFVMFKDLNENA